MKTPSSILSDVVYSDYGDTDRGRTAYNLQTGRSRPSTLSMFRFLKHLLFLSINLAIGEHDSRALRHGYFGVIRTAVKPTRAYMRIFHGA